MGVVVYKGSPLVGEFGVAVFLILHIGRQSQQGRPLIYWVAVAVAEAGDLYFGRAVVQGDDGLGGAAGAQAVSDGQFGQKTLRAAARTAVGMTGSGFLTALAVSKVPVIAGNRQVGIKGFRAIQLYIQRAGAVIWVGFNDSHRRRVAAKADPPDVSLKVDVIKFAIYRVEGNMDDIPGVAVEGLYFQEAVVLREIHHLYPTAEIYGKELAPVGLRKMAAGIE